MMEDAKGGISIHNITTIANIKTTFKRAKKIISFVQKVSSCGFSSVITSYRLHKMTQETTIITLTAIGQRLDTLLAEQFLQVSRSQIQTWIKDGLVTDEHGLPLTQASLKIKQPLVVHVSAPKKQPYQPPQAEKRSPDLHIVYEDEYLLVINKPVGLTVHPGAGRPNGTLVNMLLGHTDGNLSKTNDHERPGIVHRLDKDTGGLMVVAKTTHIHHTLAEMLQKREIKRHYQAIAWGLPQPLHGTIDAPIGRDPKNRQRMAVVTNGKHAMTHYSVLRAFGAQFSHIECRLETGRTHQIRVHLASIGHPLVGDPTYGGRYARRTKHLSENLTTAFDNLPGQALYAAELVFTHPVTNQELHFIAPTPVYFQDVLDQLNLL
jgi:23S rRNA pseudouridine1911/1915/1917 synthase